MGSIIFSIYLYNLIYLNSTLVSFIVFIWAILLVALNLSMIGTPLNDRNNPNKLAKFGDIDLENRIFIFLNNKYSFDSCMVYVSKRIFIGYLFDIFANSVWIKINSENTYFTCLYMKVPKLQGVQKVSNEDFFKSDPKDLTIDN